MTAFRRDVIEGLSRFPKRLSSKYFYDENGDRLFQEITRLPEYYLTRTETNILQKNELADYFLQEFPDGLDIYELGAGDGTKIIHLLQKLQEAGLDFQYHPIDISKNALTLLQNNLVPQLGPDLIFPIQGTYFGTLNKLKKRTTRPKVILFLGSNIGNLLHKDAIAFLSQLADAIQLQDRVMIGFDLVKDPQMIRAAYDDPTKVTAAFNKNILVRINRELGADFCIDAFKHEMVYNPESGTCASYLISQTEQVVTIGHHEFRFDRWESIHTEISQKYTHKVIRWLAEQSGFKVSRYFTDANEYFADYFFRKI